MEHATEILQLSGGQRLAVCEFGAPGGEPVIFCHGWPGSRRQGDRLHAAGRELGFRILSFDRPGIALSSPQTARTLRDWPRLMEEAAGLLGVERFRVVGVSGGGPYALVTAWAMPGRVEAAAVICGAPPIAELADGRQLMGLYRLLLTLHRRNPELVRWAFRGMRPFARVRLPKALRPLVVMGLGKSDAEALRDPVTFDAYYEAFREAWRGDADGVFEDAQLYAQPWGFAVEEIRVPVRFWHGREDRSFAWPLAEALSARIPGAQLEIVENEGHYSLPFRQARRILEGMREG